MLNFRYCSPALFLLCFALVPLGTVCAQAGISPDRAQPKCESLLSVPAIRRILSNSKTSGSLICTPDYKSIFYLRSNECKKLLEDSSSKLLDVDLNVFDFVSSSDYWSVLTKVGESLGDLGVSAENISQYQSCVARGSLESFGYDEVVEKRVLVLLESESGDSSQTMAKIAKILGSEKTPKATSKKFIQDRLLSIKYESFLKSSDYSELNSFAPAIDRIESEFRNTCELSEVDTVQKDLESVLGGLSNSLADAVVIGDCLRSNPLDSDGREDSFLKKRAAIENSFCASAEQLKRLLDLKTQFNSSEPKLAEFKTLLSSLNLSIENGETKTAKKFEVEARSALPANCGSALSGRIAVVETEHGESSLADVVATKTKIEAGKAQSKTAVVVAKNEMKKPDEVVEVVTVTTLPAETETSKVSMISKKNEVKVETKPKVLPEPSLEELIFDCDPVEVNRVLQTTVKNSDLRNFKRIILSGKAQGSKASSSIQKCDLNGLDESILSIEQTLAGLVGEERRCASLIIRQAEFEHQRKLIGPEGNLNSNIAELDEFSEQFSSLESSNASDSDSVEGRRREATKLLEDLEKYHLSVHPCNLEKQGIARRANKLSQRLARYLRELDSLTVSKTPVVNPEESSLVEAPLNQEITQDFQ